MKPKATPENIKNYIEANWNILKDKLVKLPDNFQEIIDTRSNICNSCENRKTKDSQGDEVEPYCGLCSCPLSKIVYVNPGNIEKCKAGKWKE